MNRYLIGAIVGMGTLLVGSTAYVAYENFAPEARTPRSVACEAVQKADLTKTNLAKSVESGTVNVNDMSGSVSRSAFSACDGMIGSVAYVNLKDSSDDLPLRKFSFVHGSSLKERALGIESGFNLSNNKDIERDMLKVPEIEGDRIKYFRDVISLENASMVSVKQLKLRDRNFQEVEDLDRNIGVFYIAYRTGLNTRKTSDDQIVEAIIRKYRSDDVAQVMVGPESTSYQSLQK